MESWAYETTPIPVLAFLPPVLAAKTNRPLSRVYEQKQAAQDQAAMEAIQGMSPVAWQHINLIGQFEFSAADSNVDIDVLVERYADPDCWSKSMQPAAEAV